MFTHALTTPFSPCHRSYPSLLDGGLVYTADLKGTVARLLSPTVDERALADVTRDVEAQRAHFAAMHSAGSSAGGTATMSGEHAHRISSLGGTAGGTATIASHGPQLANGGKATMSGVNAPRICSAGGKAMQGTIRKNYNKPNQTARQKADAARKRKYKAAARAAEAKVRVE